MHGKGGVHGERGMCGRGACVVGGRAWQGSCVAGRGVCVAGGRGMHGRRDGHCSGWYTSYWNAFLFLSMNSCYVDDILMEKEMNRTVPIGFFFLQNKHTAEVTKIL